MPGQKLFGLAALCSFLSEIGISYERSYLEMELFQIYHLATLTPLKGKVRKQWHFYREV